MAHGILVTIGLGIGLVPLWHQVSTWTNAVLLSIARSKKKISEIIIKIQQFSFKNMHSNMMSEKWWPFCPDLNVLKRQNGMHNKDLTILIDYKKS